jgi:hypothetical protein
VRQRIYFGKSKGRISTMKHAGQHLGACPKWSSLLLSSTPSSSPSTSAIPIARPLGAKAAKTKERELTGIAHTKKRIALAMERKNELLQEYNDSQIFLDSEDDQDKQEYLRIRKSIVLARSRKALKGPESTDRGAYGKAVVFDIRRKH